MKSDSYISYKGSVTLSVMHGNKVVQTIENGNEGSMLLMRFIANCLGSNYDATKAPRYIMAYHLEGEGMSGASPTTRVSSKPVATNFKPTYQDGSGTISSSVTLSFLIPSTLIDTDKEINRLAIYGGDDLSDDKYMAWISVDPEIQLSVGESLMVLWKMTLQNTQAPNVSND